MLFDAYRLFNQTPEKVDAALGKPIETRDTGDTGGLHFRLYEKRGMKAQVHFRNQKATYFGVKLSRPIPSAEEALLLVGVDVRKRKSFSKNRFCQEWRGSFPNPAVKKVSAVNLGNGWSEVGVGNSF